jgi:MoxR-like ATPase
MASQNPIEFEGTYPLPEAQIDRFLFKLNVGSVDVDTLDEIISTRRRGEPPKPQSSITKEELRELFAAVDRIYLPKAVSRYIARLVSATHGDSIESVGKYVSLGASPRAAIALAEAGRAQALLANRPTVGFEDVQRVATAVLNHRMILGYRARLDAVKPQQIIDELLRSVEATEMDLPEGVAVRA